MYLITSSSILLKSVLNCIISQPIHDTDTIAKIVRDEYEVFHRASSRGKQKDKTGHTRPRT